MPFQIADFGLSVNLGDSESTPTGTEIPWWDYDPNTYGAVYTKKSDVYSFGKLVWPLGNSSRT
jgi:hypothetical protein